MGMLRVDFHVALLNLEDRMLRAGRTAEALVMPAADALLSGDAEAGEAVVSRDDEIDLATHQIEDDIHDLILLQSPVADELRLLLSLSHVARSVERIGDYAVNVARLAPGVDAAHGHDQLQQQMHELALRAERAVRGGLDCFGRRDVEGVSAVADVEDRIDLLSDGLISRLITYAAEGAGAATWSIRMIQATRHFERMGDHAVGIAEQGTYVATGHRVPPRALR